MLRREKQTVSLAWKPAAVGYHSNVIILRGPEQSLIEHSPNLSKPSSTLRYRPIRCMYICRDVCTPTGSQSWCRRAHQHNEDFVPEEAACTTMETCVCTLVANILGTSVKVAENRSKKFGVGCTLIQKLISTFEITWFYPLRCVIVCNVCSLFASKQRSEWYTLCAECRLEKSFITANGANCTPEESVIIKWRQFPSRDRQAAQKYKIVGVQSSTSSETRQKNNSSIRPFIRTNSVPIRFCRLRCLNGANELRRAGGLSEEGCKFIIWIDDLREKYRCCQIKTLEVL